MTDTKEIRKELKRDLGYNARQVSVKLRHYTALYFTIRDLSVDYDKLCSYVEKYKDVARDLVTGEILCGGNIFVFVKRETE